MILGRPHRHPHPPRGSDSPNSSSVGRPAWLGRDTGACQGCPQPPEPQSGCGAHRGGGGSCDLRHSSAVCGLSLCAPSLPTVTPTTPLGQEVGGGCQANVPHYPWDLHAQTLGGGKESKREKVPSCLGTGWPEGLV